MKYILALIAALTVAGFAVPSTAEADHRYGSRRVVSYHSCGAPIYATYQIYGYDHCGNPMGRWVTDYRSHSCSRCSSRHHHHGHYDHHRSGHSYYSRPRYPYYRSSGVHFSFGW